MKRTKRKVGNNTKKKKSQSNSTQHKDRAPLAFSQPGKAKGPSSKNRLYSGSELVLDVLPDTADFACVSIPLNPGLRATFDRLAQEAELWEYWKPIKMDFVYRARCPTTERGSVMIVPEYDVNDEIPTSSRQAASSEGAIEDAVWKTQRISLNPKLMLGGLQRLRVRDSFRPGGLIGYDGGQLHICTEGITTFQIMGKIWVDYAIEFSGRTNGPQAPTSTTISAFSQAGVDYPIYPNTAVGMEMAMTLCDGMKLLTLPSNRDFGADHPDSLFLPKGMYKATVQFTFSVSNIWSGADAYVDVFFQLGGQNIENHRYARVQGSTQATGSTWSLDHTDIFPVTQEAPLSVVISAGTQASTITVLGRTVIVTVEHL